MKGRSREAGCFRSIRIAAAKLEAYLDSQAAATKTATVEGNGESTSKAN